MAKQPILHITAHSTSTRIETPDDKPMELGSYELNPVGTRKRIAVLERVQELLDEYFHDSIDCPAAQELLETEEDYKFMECDDDCPDTSFKCFIKWFTRQAERELDKERGDNPLKEATSDETN